MEIGLGRVSTSDTPEAVRGAILTGTARRLGGTACTGDASPQNRKAA
ncbi:hypothetical protein [Peribacillus sp. NPDC056705]